MFDRVRERLLDDAVERRLGLGRQPFVVQSRLEVDGEIRLLPHRRREPLQGGNQAEVVECGRAQFDCKPAHILKRRHDQVAKRLNRRATLLGLDRVLEALQPEQDGGQRLPGLVVKLPREASALDFLRMHDAAECIAADSFGQIHCDRSTSDERLGEANVACLEPRIGPELVVRGDDADRPAAHREWHIERRRDTELPCHALVDLEIVHDGVDSLRASALEYAADLRRAEVESHADELGIAGRSGYTERVGLVGQRDEHDARLDELLQPLCDEGKHRLELDLGRQRTADLIQRLELSQPAC
jgi:hypothetical protein